VKKTQKIKGVAEGKLLRALTWTWLRGIKRGTYLGDKKCVLKKKEDGTVSVD